MDEPKVSIIIPTYKDHEGLNRALRSVVNQTYQNLEIVVVNDCPEEDIGDYIEVDDDRIKTVNLEHNKGGAGEGARNVGIEKARGEFVFFLDGDDTLRSDVIELLVDKYQNSDFKVVTCWGKEKETEEILKIPKEEGDLYQRSLEVSLFIPPGPLIKRKDIIDIGNYDENVRIGDRELAMRLAEKYRIGVIKEPLYIYDAKEPGGMKERRIKRLDSQEYLLEKHPQIKDNKKAYSNLCQRMAIGHMLKGDIEESRHYFKESLNASFSFATLVTYLVTFLPKTCRELTFKFIEKNKNLLKEMGY